MTTVEATREFLIRALHTFAEQDAPYLGIVVEGKLAGAIGFNPNVDRHNRAAELFYYLAEPWQGQGYVTRAAAVLVTYGFRAMSLHRITLRAAAGNPRSWAVAERLGFHRDGVLRDAIRQDDRFDDQYVYAMLEEEWPIDAAYMPIEG
jgi:ribosomal-protein-serine acetyltransferase